MGGGVGCTAQGALARALSAARSRARQTLQFQTVQHQPTTTDCQPTLNNGIQVFVTGKLAVQLRPSPRHLPAPTLTVRSPAPPPPRPPPPRAPPRPFYLWLLLLRPAAAGPQGASGVTRGPDPRHAGRAAAALSCLRLLRRTGRRRHQPVDVFAGTRPCHTRRAPQIVHTHTRAPAVPSSPLHLGPCAVVLALPDRRG